MDDVYKATIVVLYQDCPYLGETTKTSKVNEYPCILTKQQVLDCLNMQQNGKVWNDGTRYWYYKIEKDHYNESIKQDSNGNLTSTGPGVEKHYHCIKTLKGFDFTNKSFDEAFAIIKLL